MPKKPTIKLPPQNIDAEQSVLGSILIDNNAIIKVADVLVPKDFYFPAHEKIYQAIYDLHEKHQPIDILTVTNKLKEASALKDVGGSSYLAELTNSVATASHADHFANIVKEKKVLRDLIKASAEITETAFAPKDTLEDMMDDIEQKIFSISQKSVPKNFIHIKDSLNEAFERYTTKDEAGKHMMPTGFSELDKILSGGFRKSDLIVIGARPSFGKTALSLDIARNAAMKTGLPIGIFSLEMSRDQVIDRIISSESQVPLWKLRSGHFVKEAHEEELQMLQQALDRLSRVNFFIDDTPSPNVMQMRSMARRLQMEHGLGLVMVDYLQLVRPRTNSENMVQQVTEISRGLKALARELNVPVVAVSQLSRAVDQRDSKIPRLSDLRESGSIEQDADVVMFIYRKDRDKTDVPPEEQNIAQINVAKQRNGPLGSINLRFDAERVSFKPIETKYDSADMF